MPTPSAQTYGSNKGGSAGRVGLERLSLESMATRGLWPTPGAADNGVTPKVFARGNPSLTAAVLMWPTPSAQLATTGAKSPEHVAMRKAETGAGCMNLADAVRMWPTPTASLGTHAGLVAPAKARAGGTLVVEALSLRMYPTPTAGDAKASGGRNETAAKPGSKTHPGTSLTDAVVRQTWPTPAARDGDPKRGMPSQAQVQARMESGRRNLEDAIAAQGTPAGSLNPTWVEWLQGFPLEWTVVEPGSAAAQKELAAGAIGLTASVVSATPSSGSKRRSRSKL